DEALQALRRLRRVGRDLDLDPAELVEIGSAHAIPARYLRAPRPGEDCVGAHPGPADPREPESPAVKRRGQRAPPRCRPPPWAARAAASPWTSPRAAAARRAATGSAR